MNTSLIQSKVQLPVYKMTSVVHYQAIRKATVFESLLLNFAVAYKQKMATLSLKKICEIFKIEHVFLHNALETLIDNDVLERITGDLDEIKVADLIVTELGQSLFYKNEMPSNGRKEELPCHFNPLLQALVQPKQLKKEMSGEQDALRLSTDVFPENISQIGQLIEQMINHADETMFSWKKPNINISHIEHAVDRTLWQELPIEITIDDTANLHISARGESKPSIALNSWFKGAEVEIVWDSLMAPVLKTTENHLPPIKWQDVEAVGLPNQGLEQAPTKIGIYLNDSPHKVVKGYEILLCDQITSAKLNGKTLKVPMLMDSNVGFQALHIGTNLESTMIMQGNTDLYYAKQVRTIGLQLKVKDTVVWKDLKEKLLQCIDADHLDILIFAASFLKEDELVEHAPTLSVKQTLSLHESIEKMTGKGLTSPLWVSKIQTLRSLEDLNYFRKIFPQLHLKSSWLTLELMAGVLENAFEKNTDTKTEFDTRFAPLIRANQTLKSRIHVDILKQVKQQERINISKISVSDLDVLQDWLNVYEKVCHVLPKDLVHACKKIAVQFEGLSQLKMCVEQSFAPQREDKKSVAIFDTSYLMSHSDQLKNIAKKHFIIIPQIVLHELDGLKKGNSDEKMHQARQAIRAIDELSTENIEESHFELGHFIHKNKVESLSEDEQILSVALYHRLNSAKLYSLDKNLCNVAKSVNISTQNNSI